MFQSESGSGPAATFLEAWAVPSATDRQIRYGQEAVTGAVPSINKEGFRLIFAEIKV